MKSPGQIVRYVLSALLLGGAAVSIAAGYLALQNFDNSMNAVWVRVLSVSFSAALVGALGWSVLMFVEAFTRAQHMWHASRPVAVTAFLLILGFAWWLGAFMRRWVQLDPPYLSWCLVFVLFAFGCSVIFRVAERAT